MAFGHQDADAVFRNLIASAVKRYCGTRARRVDRVEHNDDIDDRIIAEIEEADFVIADLTYARPSVYFEAGFAQRKVPVIYTVRSDHLDQKFKNEDPFGNLQVHFDLKMKNIITWRGTKDLVFLRRLESRIRLVMRPILTQRTEATQHAARIATFEGMALQKRLRAVQTTAFHTIKSLGYRDVMRFNVKGAISNNLFRVEKQVLRIATIKSVDSLKKAELSAFEVKADSVNYDLNLGGKRPKICAELILLCSLRKVSHGIISSILNQYDFDVERRSYSRWSICSSPSANLFKKGNKVIFGRELGAHVLNVITPDGHRESLRFRDGYYGGYRVVGRGGQSFKRVSKEVVIPRFRTYAILDGIRETVTLCERINSCLAWFDHNRRCLTPPTDLLWRAQS